MASAGAGGGEIKPKTKSYSTEHVLEPILTETTTKRAEPARPAKRARGESESELELHMAVFWAATVTYTQLEMGQHAFSGGFDAMVESLATVLCNRRPCRKHLNRMDLKDESDDEVFSRLERYDMRFVLFPPDEAMLKKIVGAATQKALGK